jgi:hypothetical protein
MMKSNWPFMSESSRANKVCQICESPCGDTYYDAKMKTGAWADMCETCFTLHAGKVGTGYSQKYQRNSNGIFTKILG